MKTIITSGILAIGMAIGIVSLTSASLGKKETNAYLEITLDIKSENRASAAGVYLKYKAPFLEKIDGATSKELLLRGEDVQVLHGFESEEQANNYLSSALFEKDVVRELKPYLASGPEIRVYKIFKK